MTFTSADLDRLKKHPAVYQNPDTICAGCGKPLSRHFRNRAGEIRCYAVGDEVFSPQTATGAAAGKANAAPTLPQDCLKRPIRSKHKPLPEQTSGILGANILRLAIRGRIMGGKNSMGVTQTGRHYAKTGWRKWRDGVVLELICQLPKGWTPITAPCTMSLDYVAATRRRHDMPAILDSLFHCLERAGVVADDAHIWVNRSTRDYKKGDASTTMELTF